MPTPKSLKPVRQTNRWQGSGFEVEMVDGWRCHHCARPLRPSAVRRDDDTIFLICEDCHNSLLRVELGAAG